MEGEGAELPSIIGDRGILKVQRRTSVMGKVCANGGKVLPPFYVSFNTTIGNLVRHPRWINPTQRNGTSLIK